MGFTDIDNTDLNTAAAAVPAPFGPFTRVGNAADVSPNSHLPVEMTASLARKRSSSAMTHSAAPICSRTLSKTRSASTT